MTASRADDPPRIDGQLDDIIWQRATRLTEFVQVRPLDGAPATEETEVWVARVVKVPMSGQTSTNWVAVPPRFRK